MDFILPTQVEKLIIGDQDWAEMTEGQKVDAVVAGRATLKQMSEGLLDGSEQLRSACSECLAHTTPSFENLPAAAHEHDSLQSRVASQQSWSAKQTADSRLETGENNESPPAHGQPETGESAAFEITRSKLREAHDELMQRLGRPRPHDPALQRYGRSILIELNIYRLPDGREFIPCRPTGTLGANRHLYALLTSEQFLKAQRGSVYVRDDGRIFDYSVDSKIPQGEIFETGYTIADLERTGRYAPQRKRRRKKIKVANLKRAAATGSR